MSLYVVSRNLKEIQLLEVVIIHALSLTCHDARVGQSNGDDNDDDDNVLLMTRSHIVCGSSSSLKTASRQPQISQPNNFG